MAARLGDLFDSGQMCDVVLRVTSASDSVKTFHAHSLVLKLCGLKLPDRDQDSSQSFVMDIQEDPDSFSLVLSFIYKGTLPPRAEQHDQFGKLLQKYNLAVPMAAKAACQTTAAIANINKRKRFVCKQCRIVLNSSRQSAKHRIRRPAGGKWKCETCSKKYPSDCSAFLHSAKTQHVVFACLQCDKVKAKNKKAMLVHDCEVKPAAKATNKVSKTAKPAKPAVTAAVKEAAAGPTSDLDSAPPPTVTAAAPVAVAASAAPPPAVRIASRLPSVEDRLNNQKLTIGWDMDDVPLMPPDILMEEDDDAIGGGGGGGTGGGSLNIFGITIAADDYPEISEFLTNPEELRKKSKNSYLCSLCGKTLKGLTSYTRHQVTHSGAKPFQCHLCPKSFTQNQRLTIHKRTHTGERP